MANVFISKQRAHETYRKAAVAVRHRLGLQPVCMEELPPERLVEDAASSSCSSAIATETVHPGESRSFMEIGHDDAIELMQPLVKTARTARER